jgi:hypothetical protein
MAAETLLARWLARPESPSYPAFAEKVGADRARIHRCARAERRPGLVLAIEIEKATGGEVPASYWPTVKLVKPAVRGSRRRSRKHSSHSK